MDNNVLKRPSIRREDVCSSGVASGRNAQNRVAGTLLAIIGGGAVFCCGPFLFDVYLNSWLFALSFTVSVGAVLGAGLGWLTDRCRFRMHPVASSLGGGIAGAVTGFAAVSPIINSLSGSEARPVGMIAMGLTLAPLGILAGWKSGTRIPRRMLLRWVKSCVFVAPADGKRSEPRVMRTWAIIALWSILLFVIASLLCTIFCMRSHFSLLAYAGAILVYVIVWASGVAVAYRVHRTKMVPGFLVATGIVLLFALPVSTYMVSFSPIGRWAAGLNREMRSVPARGQVLLDGVPLAEAQVRFVPLRYVNVRGGITPFTSPHGTTDPQGRFQMARSIARGSVTSTTWVESPGVPPGIYRVTVSRFVQVTEAESTDAEDDGSSVAAPGTKAKWAETVPSRYTRAETSPFEIDVPATGRTDLLFELTTLPE